MSLDEVGEGLEFLKYCLDLALYLDEGEGERLLV